jgi:hypothetical protein
VVSSSVDAHPAGAQLLTHACPPATGPLGLAHPVARAAGSEATRGPRQPAGAAGLENYASSVSPPPGEGRSGGRRRRYARRSILWNESSLSRVRKCGRIRHGELVGVRAGANGGGFSGLVTCGSVWACPVCNAKIAAVRRLEVGAAVAAWMARGGAVIFMTRTLRHHKGQRLSDLWTGLAGAWRSMLGGQHWKKRGDTLGLHGLLRVIETTTGRNGWHVHVHSLLFVAGTVTDDQVEDFGGWSAARWSRAVVRQKLPAPLAIGQDVRVIRDVRDSALADYLAKMDEGGRPADALGLELTHTQSKTARDAHSTRPVWDLLTDVAAGDADALDLWHEWEAASKGRKQLFWSRGLRRDLLGATPEREDEVIASEEAGDRDLLWITPDGWASLVASPGLIPKVLDAVEHSLGLLVDFLTSHGIDHLLPEGTDSEQSTAQSSSPGPARGGVPRRVLLAGRARASRLGAEHSAGGRLQGDATPDHR